MIKLNQSQTAILHSQQAFPGSAENTISVRVRFLEHDVDAVKPAVDRVLQSADIFSAKLVQEKGEYGFLPGAEQVHTCQILPEMPWEQVRRYTEGEDIKPMDFPEKLYRAELIPIEEGGCALYICFHHILTDGHGVTLLVQSIFDVMEGRKTDLLPYFSCNTEEKAPVEEPAEDSAEADFWREYFSDSRFEPGFYQDVPKSTGRQVFRAQLPAERVKELKRFANAQGVSLPYVLGAALSVYLAEATDREEAVFLMPRLGRTKEQMRMVACFTVVVPIRVKVGQKDTFGEICRRVKESAQQASAHKNCGYEKILQILRGENVFSDSLAEYVLNYCYCDLNTHISHELEVNVSGAMHNHLTWSMFKKGEGLELHMDGRDGIYDEERAGAFADSMEKILEAGRKNATVEEISIIGDAERERLGAVRGKTVAVGEEDTIPSLFAEAVQKYADRPALYAGGNGYTFEELDRVSDRIAAALSKRGVKPGDKVAFMLRRDIRLIPTMLAILKSGAVFIPVDPEYPRDRVQYILEDAGAAFLVSSADVKGSEEYTYLEIDELLQEAEEKFTPPVIAPQQTAYMIYTSGTTGRPKGVILPHRGIVNIVHPDNNPFNRDVVKDGTGITAIGSVCFDISLFEIFVPLLNGLFIEFGNEKSMLDARELARHIRAHGADILHCTPSRLVSYLADQEFSEAVKGVKMVLAAGEVLPKSLIHELKNDYGIRIYNGYGPTETTIGATITEAGDSESIGLPIANTGLLLLNSHLKQVPFGAVGEICVYGRGVGMGYQNRPEETAEKFVDYEGRTIYRTGDIGHYIADKRLIYHGRNDRQIKLRGLRIELSEIERVLDAFEGVAQAHCLVRTINKVEHLTAFYTVESGKSVDAQELLGYMKGSLTAYMVPDILKELPAMPQTPGGKTDIRALEKEAVEFVRVYREPRGDRERAVCLAFSHVLEQDRIGVDDNFFELGGDSLMVAALLVEIEDRLGIEGQNLIEFSDVFTYPTPALLAEKIGGKVKRENPYQIDELDYEGIADYLSVDQEDQTVGNLGNILLTGVTGYLGIHILLDLLKRPQLFDKVYCLVRGADDMSAEMRVKISLFYYAEDDFAEDYGVKWEVLEGDLTEPNLFKEPFEERIDLIINSAANVAHFAYGDALSKINVGGVKNLIDYALAKDAMLCQVSTVSVGGVYPVGEKHGTLTEQDLYLGQEINNEYIYSKYMAEYALLRAAIDHNLPVRIARVGNLQGRSQDGEFQMNMKSNAFTRRLASYIQTGAIPASVYAASVNFSPVDETAHMIVSLATLKGKYPVFHVYPSEEVAFSQLIAGLERLGHEIKVIPDEEFDELVQKLKKTKEGASAVEGLLTDIQAGRYLDIPVSEKFTNGQLKLMGEDWLECTDEYLDKYLSALNDMYMF